MGLPLREQLCWGGHRGLPAASGDTACLENHHPPRMLGVCPRSALLRSPRALCPQLSGLYRPRLCPGGCGQRSPLAALCGGISTLILNTSSEADRYSTGLSSASQRPGGHQGPLCVDAFSGTGHITWAQHCHLSSRGTASCVPPDCHARSPHGGSCWRGRYLTLITETAWVSSSRFVLETAASNTLCTGERALRPLFRAVQAMAGLSPRMVFYERPTASVTTRSVCGPGAVAVPS